MRKKIISFLLIIVMLGTFAVPTALAEGNIIADLTSLSVINGCSLSASNEQVKTGSFTMKWNGVKLHDNIEIPIKIHDFTKGNFLEFWVYSELATNMKFTVSLVSDTKETRCLDYYYKTITVDWKGWKLISLSLGAEGDFTEKNTPVGYDNIQRIELWPKFEGSLPVEGTCLYFDKMILAENQNEEAISGGKDDELIKTTIADFSILQNISQAGFPASQDYVSSGSYTLQMKGESVKNLNITPLETDWSDYYVLKMNIYSARVAESPIYIVASSNNPDTEKNDGYRAKLTIDWTGWKTVELYLNEGIFSLAYEPLGWHEITTLGFSPFYTKTEDHTDTEIYIDKIWLETSGGRGSKDDYIIPVQNLPTDVEYVDMINEKNPNNEHPRLLIEPDFWEKTKESIKTDTYLSRTYNRILGSADAALKNTTNTPFPSSYQQANRAKLQLEWAMIPNLTIAYKMTGEQKYKDRLWQALENITGYSNWNKGSYLDVGDWTEVISYAYDWMYYDWTEEERITIRNGLVKLGFQPAMNYWRNKTGFARNLTNWSSVINSGLGLAAIAISGEEKYDDLCNEVLNGVVDALTYGNQQFAPDGASPESPGYWLYAQQLFFQFQAALQLAAGVDGGLSQIEGTFTTGDYILAMNAPSKLCYNYSDSGDGSISDGVFHWMSKLFNKPGYANFRIQDTNGAGDWLDFVMYDAEAKKNDDYGLPLDMKFGGEEHVGMMRSSWSDSNAVYLGYKGGYNQSNHGHLDIGGFILDSQGQRWFVELGPETYGKVPNFSTFEVGSNRWKYYKNRAEGHNTLVINPKNAEDQNPYAMAEIIEQKSCDTASYSVVDMTEAYQDDATRAVRGFALVNNRSTVIIQDEIINKSACDVYSFFHTPASFEIPDDNTRSVILELEGKKMKAEILSPANAVFKKMDPAPLVVKPLDGIPNDTLKNVNKLAVYAPGTSAATITVVFTPVYEDVPEMSAPQLLPINEWDAYLEESISLASLSVDGIPLDNFASNNTSYSVPDGTIGVVSAVSDGDITTEIVQATEENPMAYVIARSATSGQNCVYSVDFTQRVPGSVVDMLQSYTVQKVTASAVPQPEHIPENTLDNNLSSRWTAEGEHWIMWDFGEPKALDTINLAFYSGDVRRTFFKLELSNDGTNFTTVFDGESSGTTLQPEAYRFPLTTARYVRYSGRGNSVNKWNNITEFSVPVVKNYTDIENHWAEEDIKYLSEIGLVNGVNDTTFAPDKNITVAEFIAMAVRTAGVAAVEYRGELKDVQKTDWYANDIQAAIDYGYLPKEMYAGNVVNPTKLITREEMSAIAVSLYEKKTDKVVKTYGLDRFADVGEISEYAKVYVDKGITIRLIRGIDDTHFAPKANATRAQASVIIKRLFVIAAD